jgi:hypothetical protein
VCRSWTMLIEERVNKFTTLEKLFKFKQWDINSFYFINSNIITWQKINLKNIILVSTSIEFFILVRIIFFLFCPYNFKNNCLQKIILVFTIVYFSLYKIASQEAEIWKAKWENTDVVVKRIPIKYQNKVGHEELSKGP